MSIENNCLKFLQKIVSTKSLSRQEMSVAKIVANEMKSLNYDFVKVDKYGNVVGKIGNGRKKILYDAHIDTVGISDIKKWKTNPYKATYKNGNVYGRGSCDDKGCVSAMVYAGALIKKQNLLNDFTLFVSASAREETGEPFWFDYITKQLKFKPDCVVIGEPSDMKIIRGHKGRSELKITVFGKSVHASVPNKGDNAIYKAIDYIKKINMLNNKYKSKELGKPVISVTQIETKNASTNTIPDNCSFFIDRRTIENETAKNVADEIKQICNKDAVIDYQHFFKAWILPKEHHLVRSTVNSFKTAFIKQPNVTLWPFCTNGSFTMGEKNIPSIGFGPGSEKYAHVANEQIKFKDVLNAIKLYSIFPSIYSK
ncbi:MAG: hypothetical protein A2539_02085 [Elusimicrobia bacterium RIFOXYD2_FULL_34_15]|nr:MAG: hypothetical protein A2539_02085 [Elusimicrobia bacterium RIFOXYD2_FULL_34_15]